MSAIAIHRPGAIGDLCMLANLLPALWKQSGALIDIYADRAIGDALRPTLLAAGANGVFDCATLPQVYGYERVVHLMGYPTTDDYTVIPDHIIRLFADELGVQLHRGEYLPQLTLPLPKAILSGAYATLQTSALWSRYKEWPVERWAQVVARLPFPVVQLSLPGEARVEGALQFQGSLQQAIALVANARMHIGVDSVFQHIAHYRWQDGDSFRKVPSLILWGSTQQSATGYEDNVNINTRLSCSPCFRESPLLSCVPRGPCPHLDAAGMHPCMGLIDVESVTSAALLLWEKSA